MSPESSEAGLPTGRDQTVLGIAAVLQDDTGRIWLAPVPQDDHGSGVMPHIRPGDTVHPNPGEGGGDLETEQFVVEGTAGTAEYNFVCDAVALPDLLGSWVTTELHSPVRRAQG